MPHSLSIKGPKLVKPNTFRRLFKPTPFSASRLIIKLTVELLVTSV
jgi:hypothetical protein